MKCKLLALALTLVLLFTLVSLPISADVGNVDWGGGGGGGGDWGGGDWGGGYDYGYSDYGSDYVGDGSTDGWVFAVIVIGAILLFFWIKNIGPGKKGGAATATVVVRQSGANSITAEQEAAVVAQIRAVDPDFSAEQMRSYAADVILRVQEAWESRDWGVVRPYESDKLFAVHQRQLEELIEKKLTNHMDNQYIERTTLAGFTVDGSVELLTVRIDMSLSDYTTSDESGEVVSGVQNMKCVRAYRLEFIRTAGTKTDTAATVKSHSCPSCGAPLDLNASGRCAYCDCVVTSGQYGWVLNSYNKW